MERDIARVGAIAGWIVLAGILVVQVAIPSAIAGMPLSGMADPSAITAHYDHPELEPLVALQFLLLIPIVVFAVALRETLAAAGAARFAAALGLAFLLVEVPMLAAQFALQGTLVTLATAGDDVWPIFRFWDLLYNGALYAIEAGVVVSFGLAARGHDSFPRWLPTFALVVGALQIVNIGGVFGWIPTGVTLVGNLGFGAWLAASSHGLMRAASRPAAVPTR